MAELDYEQVPYPTIAFAETHPRRLQAVAHLFGLASAPPTDCRVLELGCAVGGNIVPMARGLPGSRFVGVDLSEGQIAAARAFAVAVGASNVDLRAASITDVTPEWGQFDYIICHGVYSWVPTEVREKILQICGEQLSERGVAYVSFNVYPGWHTRTWMRDAMRFHAEGTADPNERARAGRDFIVALSESPLAPPDKVAVLRAEAAYLRDKDESYILHDYFEAENAPVYFRDFARAAAARGLQYLGDGKRNTGAEAAWEPARRWFEASGDDVVRAEQYADFISNRMFRRTLLCRAQATLDRSAAAVGARLAGMSGETFLRQWSAGAGATRFEHPSGLRYVTTSPDVRSALAAVGSRFPRAMPLAELLNGRPPHGEVAQALLHCWRIGMLRLYVDPPVFAAQPSATPRAGVVARHLVAGGRQPINLRHETITLPPEHRAIVPLLDGTRARDELAAGSGLPREAVDRALAHLAMVAVLEQ